MSCLSVCYNTTLKAKDGGHLAVGCSPEASPWSKRGRRIVLDARQQRVYTPRGTAANVFCQW